MNIKEAKKQIKNAMTAYFTKNEHGNYRIPIEKQRPVFLMGPPGIGKTAIMEQIAEELGVGLVSYSMTHHTRQSALGLPFIVSKNYGGQTYEVSEYTMSEIIASVYDMMETTGHREGILFLDEINCVSETLAPAMLQFLQYKVFGRHAVPKGWIVVTAGNPPEYNHSVREFDIVTWDRLKRIDVEPDYAVWKEFAVNSGVHPSVTTFLDIKKDDFYRVETTVDGKSFVTARGWSDLSEMIRLYEENGLTVDEDLVSQYLQNRRIAKEFAIYYDLFNKYQADYQVQTILQGKAGEEIKKRAASAGFDERLSLLGMLLDAINVELKAVVTREKVRDEVLQALKMLRTAAMDPSVSIAEVLGREVGSIGAKIENGRRSASISEDTANIYYTVSAVLERQIAQLGEKQPKNNAEAFKLIKADFDADTAKLKKAADEAGRKLTNVFTFCEEVFGEGQELLILVTELTVSSFGAHFISTYGCEAYFAHNSELLFHERQKKILAELDGLESE